MNHKAVFIDKDGTLVENNPYNVDVTQIRLMEGALEGLRLLHQAGYKIIVVSNQSGVARGYFPLEALDGVRTHLGNVLSEAGVPLTGFYFCPHWPDGSVADYARECFCRKPRPGMLFQAAREHELNLTNCWMVGDILDDIEAGRRAGCNAVLVENGGETEWLLSPLRTPNRRVKSLLEAARAIIESDRVVPVERSAAALKPTPAARQAGVEAARRAAAARLPATGSSTTPRNGRSSSANAGRKGRRPPVNPG
jgi:D-glycero-D-manno-heptose 1,7-bisphosphate phosphatase